MDSDFSSGVTFYRPDIINEIRAGVQRTNNRLKKHGLSPVIFAEQDKSNLFILRKARDWMAREHNTPQPRKLLGDLWMEGELCILFADTNLGKSILAVQIGNSLTTDQSVGPFANQLPPLTPVLYIDFELGAKQFQSRYTDTLHGDFAFGESFHRAEFNPQANNPALFDNYNNKLIAALETAIMNSQAKVVIIDNLTYMRNGTERAKDALPLMKELKALKTKHKLSVLCLAHTPKRNAAKPITVNDLQGSKMIINFCDSAFAIGQSFTTAGGRYIKQIKQRSNSQVYGADNVCLCHIVKEMNNLHFEFDGFAHEADHLQQPRDRNQLKQQAIELQQQGHSYRQISQQLNIGLATVNRFLTLGLVD